MDTRAREVLKIGDSMFSKKSSVDSLWQEIALNFYPERADFTTKRDDGEEFSDHLFSSFPVLARRELGNIFASNLRPRSAKWFSAHVDDEDLDKGQAERAYLEFITDVQWRATYDAQAGFVRATKEADHDFAAFGNAALRVTRNIVGDGLLFRSYHLRDCAWAENAEGRVDCLHRNWNPTARQLVHHFGEGKVSSEVKKAFSKDPEKEFTCRHVVMPNRLYDYKSPMGRKSAFTSLYVERDSETVLEEVGINFFDYVVPRWQTVSGSPYGRSMATCVALPDGRTLQVVTRVIREAGEKYVDPPMIAIMDAIRSDISLYAGGITTADMEYDERLGEVLRPISQDKSGFPIGAELAAALREDLRQAFFLDKINLPDVGKDMTAYETRKIIEQNIRAQAPIFEPVEQEYNTPLCETVFEVLREGGAFGPVEKIPETLRGAEIKYSFRSPLADMADQSDAAIFEDVMQSIWLPAAQIDPAQLENVNITTATRDAARAKGWKAKWFQPEEAVAQKRAEMQRQADLERGMATLGTAGAVAEQGGKGAAALQQAGVT